MARVPISRYRCAATALLLALHCLPAPVVHAQASGPASRSIEAVWQAERAFHLNSVMERARATIAGGAGAESERMLAGLEARVAADAKRTARPAKTLKDIATLRTQLYKALNNLDGAELRFANGMLTTWERDWTYRVVVNLLLS